MKHLASFLLSITLLSSLYAVSFSNLNSEAHLSGPQITKKELQGRVIAIEEWGYRCPPCLASLQHVARLAKTYEKDTRVAVIGSHVQGRDEEGILAVLKKNKCEYPVYQQLDVDGAPSGSGIPFAYVFNHKGEVVWQGNPYSQHKEMEAAVAAAVKAMPKLPAGSLLTGLDIQHCKDVIKRLVAGQNIESVLRQLQTRAERGGVAAEEAKQILERCTAWADEAEANIREALETHPSKAIADAQIYMRTFPKRTAELKKELAEIVKDPIVSKLAASRAALNKLSQANAATPNARKKLYSQAKMQLRQLSTLAIDKANEDYQDVKALWEAFAETMATDKK